MLGLTYVRSYIYVRSCIMLGLMYVRSSMLGLAYVRSSMLGLALCEVLYVRSYVC